MPLSEVLLQLSCRLPLRCWQAAIRCPPCWTAPSPLSLSSHEKCSSLLIIFIALLQSRSSRSTSLLCQGPQIWTNHSSFSWGPMRAEWLNPLPRLAGHAAFNAAQDAVGCKHTVLGCVGLLMNQPELSSLSRRPLLSQTCQKSLL